jgi:hypothetical protein
MTPSDRFNTPRILPANGTIAVRNASNTLHIMNIWPVRPGTTDHEIQSWLEDPATADSPLLDGPAVGLTVLSPGRRVQLGYHLPPGTYVLFCEIPDPETGIPHIFAGMHTVVTLS